MLKFPRCSVIIKWISYAKVKTKGNFMLNKKLDKILPKVQKPGRYVGGELNSVIKNKEDVDVRFAFCFPDVYV